MCFSAEADFVAGAAISVVGVATLTEARAPKELPLAILPLAFGLHQVTEGFVWLGLEGETSASVGRAAMYLYLAFAWAVLPLLAPLAILLVEPLRRRRRVLTPLVVLGGVVGVLLAYRLVVEDVSARINGHVVEYFGGGGAGGAITAGYVVATCGAFLLSSRPYVRWFGVANAVAVAIVVIVHSQALTSVWCVWAAIVSFLVYLQLRSWRRAERTRVEQREREPSGAPRDASRVRP